MVGWRRNLWLLILGTFLVSSSYSMVVPFLPLFLLQLGTRRGVEVWSGLLFSVSYLTGALFSPLWGWLADRYGRRQMLLRAGFGLSAVYIATAFVTNRTELLLLRLLQGAVSGYIPGAITLIGSTTPETEVGYALSLISTASATGNIVGPLFGGILAHFLGNREAFFSAGLLMLLPTAIALFGVREPPRHSVARHAAPTGFRQLLRSGPLVGVLLCTLATYFATMTIEPVLPLYVVELGGSVRNASLLAGIVFSISGIAGILFTPQWGRMGDRVGFRTTLLIGLVGGGIGSLLQIPVHSIVGFTVVRFFYGAAFSAVLPALNGQIVRFTSKSLRGQAFGLGQSANQLGTMLGPLVGGAVASAYGIHQVFWLTGFLLLATAALATLLPNTVPNGGSEGAA